MNKVVINYPRQMEFQQIINIMPHLTQIERLNRHETYEKSKAFISR